MGRKKTVLARDKKPARFESYYLGRDSMMTARLAFTALSLGFAIPALAEVPANIVADGVPEIDAALIAATAPYMESRSASFQGWNDATGSALISTRFGNTAQLHEVKMPGGARTQITFAAEPIAGGGWQSKSAGYLFFVKDNGGDEYFQGYRIDAGSGKPVLLTDGKSRNQGFASNEDGTLTAYASTRRTGKDNDIYLMDPRDAKTDRLILQRSGGGWNVDDFSADASQLVLGEYISINESNLHIMDIKSGTVRQLTPTQGKVKTVYGDAQYAPDGMLYLLTDQDSEFRRLVSMDPATGKTTPVSAETMWDVEEYQISDDGSFIAYVVNEAGSSRLRLIDRKTGKSLGNPALPSGILGGLDISTAGEIGFTLSSAKSPGDVYSVNSKTLAVTRWTMSETGGLNTAAFVEPELVKVKSFDGLEVSGFLNIHGGPEGQTRPGYQGRNNYLINELGMAIFYPNVRGSEGYGKTFLKLDNGFKREDSVKDIGAFIDALAKDTGVDKSRIAVTGGSYGGYMTLASMTFYNDKLRAGLEIVGISNFVTFLKNTNPYRVDLRRVEYGDEREPKMNAFLQKISPLNNISKVSIPLMVVTGANDPRVPASEADQVVAAVRKQGGKAWHVLAKDEGHGFRKKPNQDYQFWSSVTFWQQTLLK
jgi:dipeptidyl aminopeptidase/acylaminoacyl peptidase